jgi:hypothetical protein
MLNHRDPSRRSFLKFAAATAAFFMIPLGKAVAFLSTVGWRADLKINPLIDNVKAVCCFDDAMAENKIAGDFAHQNEGVNNTLIAANMDDMAKRLTNKNSPADAWKIIFRKPSLKEWNQVRAAIKVSCANVLNMPRLSIVNKVCAELIILGVLPGNITLYDTLHNASGTGKYGDSQGNPVAGLPAGIKVSTTTAGGPDVPVGSGTMPCSPVIAQENAGAITYTADILVNIAANNGSNSDGSELDLCMYNHIGTLKLSVPSADELVDMNQCEAIIGGSSDPCRQQFCIIDSLWAVAGGTGPYTHVPCRIVMGTLAPMVDYLTAQNIRQRAMNAPYTAAVTADWLSRFGYAASDAQWIEFTPSTDTRGPHREAFAGTTIISIALGPSGSARAARFSMPSLNSPVDIDVFTLGGRHLLHRTLAATRGRSIPVAWPDLGMRLCAGRYTIRCRMDGEEQHLLAEVLR